MFKSLDFKGSHKKSSHYAKCPTIVPIAMLQLVPFAARGVEDVDVGEGAVQPPHQ